MTPARGGGVDVGPGYSRFVGLMKVGLPLAAFLIIVVVIAWPNIQDEQDGFRLTFSRVENTADGSPEMVNARFVGSDGTGRPFLVTAETAAKDADNPNIVTLSNLQADLTMRSGTWMTLTSGQGVFHRLAGSLSLSGPVDIFSDLGYEFHAGDTVLDLEAGTAVSDQPVNGQGPFGVLTARSFRFGERGQRLFFKGKVKLVLKSLAQQ